MTVKTLVDENYTLEKVTLKNVNFFSIKGVNF
jgi:hypothetical protein